MTSTDIESTASEIIDEPGREIVPAPIALAVTPTVTAEELVSRLAVIHEAADKAMTENVDYGKIPGTDKPTLLKPGAEKLGVLFQLDVQLSNEKRWGPGDHLTVTSHATVFHAPSGSRLGYGEGVCSTRERKYAYRRGERLCPKCHKPAIIKGKAEYGGGWLCWKKKDGCDSKFSDGTASIEGQRVGDIENPDLPDLWNTVVKMAEKRARIDAVLAVTGASAMFTQDIEDFAPAEAEVVQRAERLLDATPVGPAKLSDRQQSIVRKAFADAGADVDLFLPTVGLDSLADATSDDAKKLRELLDEARAAA